jgi:hypothetical protein
MNKSVYYAMHVVYNKIFLSITKDTFQSKHISLVFFQFSASATISGAIYMTDIFLFVPTCVIYVFAAVVMVAEYSFIQIFFCTDSFLNCTVCSSYITELCRSHSNIGTFCMIKACIFLG